MTVGEATRQYQSQLEAVRTIFASDIFDDEDRTEALVELGHARDALEVAWLERTLNA